MLDPSAMSQFYGTSTWTVLPVFGVWKPQVDATDPRPLGTEGVMYVLENGGQNGAFWLWDVIASHYRTNQRVRNESFLHITLKVNEDKSADFSIDDGNDVVLATQHIPYTDFDPQGIQFYFTTNVLLLPSEY